MKSNRVLLIEDDPQAAELTKILLNEGTQRYDVLHASTLQEALRQASDETLHVVLMDLSLPDSRGIETFRTFHAAFPDLPVVILTGVWDEEIGIEAMKDGAQDYLLKGQDDLYGLSRVLRYAMERKRTITETTRLQNLLYEQNKMEALGILTGGIAHEINTPVQFVTNNLQFMKLTLPRFLELAEEPSDANGDQATARRGEWERLTAEYQAALDDSLEGLNRVISIVHEMNVYSHTGQEHPMPCDINRAIMSAVTLTRNEWKNIARMDLDLAPDIPLVPCLFQEFSQAMLNLIVNAVHAISDSRARGKSDGVIAIRSCLSHDQVEIWIRDTGDGIPEAIQSKIFTPFFTTKTPGKGSGRGLAMVRKVIQEKHGGTITFQSKSGEGTTFMIRLPMSKPVLHDTETAGMEASLQTE